MCYNVLKCMCNASSFYPENVLQDNTVRIWKRQEDSKMKCVGIGQGHTHVVSCVALPRYQDIVHMHDNFHGSFLHQRLLCL